MINPDPVKLAVDEPLGAGFTMDRQGTGTDLGQRALSRTVGEEPGDQRRTQAGGCHGADCGSLDESGAFLGGTSGHSMAEIGKRTVGLAGARQCAESVPCTGFFGHVADSVPAGVLAACRASPPEWRFWGGSRAICCEKETKFRENHWFS
jgi:hypothetical protein